MKGIVNTYLNIRTGKPEIQGGNNPGYYAPNQELDIVDQHIGDFYKYTNVWYELANGGYVWSGGVNIATNATPFARSKDINYWLDVFGLSSLANRGQGVKIAVVDTGINAAHQDFAGTKLQWSDFVKNVPNPEDYDGHGTHCCGIIAGNEQKRIEGVAPFAELYVAKVLYKKGMPSPVYDTWLYNGMQWACNNADIISISLGMADSKWSGRFQQLIDNAVAAGKIIVCAIGNNETIQSNIGDYPAKYANCISVGALDFNFNLSALTRRYPKTDICLPGEFITSAYAGAPDSYYELSGTSMATPLLAGILALKKQKNKNFGLAEARTFINQVSETKTTDGFTYKAIKNQHIPI